MLDPTPPAESEPKALRLPAALLTEEIEPNAIAVVSAGEDLYLCAFTGQVGEDTFIAKRVWKLDCAAAAQLGRDVTKTVGEIQAPGLHIVGADQAPPGVRG